MTAGDIVTFDTKKSFTFIRSLGAGGTGDTHLFRDETTDILFAIKKYVPKDRRKIDSLYSRFVDEIKILLNISHPNIVRIYNYYLYPEAKTGFLQMEYIDGICVDQYNPMPWEKGWEDIFRETINAFEYLEDHHILHRDIRPANIMIDNNGNVKIIDFGFGKRIEDISAEKNSVLLNWPATVLPDEVIQNQEYDERTEIYFVGTLFRHLLKDDIDGFRFAHIIDRMVKTTPVQRYGSFREIAYDISVGVMSAIDFSLQQKTIYRTFADALSAHIYSLKSKQIVRNDIDQIISDLGAVIRTSALEIYIQDNRDLINCFIANGYTLIDKKDILVKTVADFYSLSMELNAPKKKILFDNIFNRISSIRVEPEDNELPF